MCKQCQTPKPLTSFPLNAKGNGPPRRAVCRKCVRNNRKAKGRCQCNRPLKTGTRCETCQRGQQKDSQERRQRDKHAALVIYGGKCVYCGESREIFLTIDHKNNDGAEHRRQVTGLGASIYRWLRQNGYLTGFQTACFNCNCAKEIRILTGAPIPA